MGVPEEGVEVVRGGLLGSGGMPVIVDGSAHGEFVQPAMRGAFRGSGS